MISRTYFFRNPNTGRIQRSQSMKMPEAAVANYHLWLNRRQYRWQYQCNKVWKTVGFEDLVKRPEDYQLTYVVCGAI